MTGEQKKLARRQAIADAGGEPDVDYDVIPAHSAGVTLAALRRLEKDARVKHVSVDHPVQGSLDLTAQVIGADQVWKGYNGLPQLNGNGVTVAVIDSGIYPHPDFGSRILTNKLFFGAALKKPNATDGYGHGTHVAGIIGSASSI